MEDKRYYLKPAMQVAGVSVYVCRTDSDRIEEASQRYRLVHGDYRVDDEDDESDPLNGCLGMIVVFAIATFGIGAGIFHCI